MSFYSCAYRQEKILSGRFQCLVYQKNSPPPLQGSPVFLKFILRFTIWGRPSPQYFWTSLSSTTGKCLTTRSGWGQEKGPDVYVAFANFPSVNAPAMPFSNHQGEVTEHRIGKCRPISQLLCTRDPPLRGKLALLNWVTYIGITWVVQGPTSPELACRSSWTSHVLRSLAGQT